MFQYAFGCHYAVRYGVVYYYPSEWEGSTLFEPFPLARVITNKKLNQCLLRHPNSLDRRKQCYFTSYSSDFVDFHNYQGDSRNVVFDDIGMMYYANQINKMSTPFIRKHVFKLSSLVKGTQMYQEMKAESGRYVVAHVRRGDIAMDTYKGGHSCVTLKSYRDKLQELRISESDVVWVSEDSTISTKHKWHCSVPHKWNYPVGTQRLSNDHVYDFLPDFLIIYFARIVLRGNSGFSWWAAELSGGEVYSPIVPHREKTVVGPNWIDCKFVRGNHPHFMGLSTVISCSAIV